MANNKQTTPTRRVLSAKQLEFISARLGGIHSASSNLDSIAAGYGYGGPDINELVELIDMELAFIEACIFEGNCDAEAALAAEEEWLKK